MWSVALFLVECVDCSMTDHWWGAGGVCHAVSPPLRLHTFPMSPWSSSPPPVGVSELRPEEAECVFLQLCVCQSETCFIACSQPLIQVILLCGSTSTMTSPSTCLHISGGADKRWHQASCVALLNKSKQVRDLYSRVMLSFPLCSQPRQRDKNLLPSG